MQGSGSASGGTSTATPTCPLSYTAPSSAGSGGRGRPHPRGRGKETNLVLSSGKRACGSPLTAQDPGCTLQPARPGHRARREDRRTHPALPEAVQSVRGAVPGRPVGFSDVQPPDTKSATGDPGEVPGRALCVPPAGRPGTDASDGVRACPSEVRRPSARRPCTPPSPRAPSACRAGSLTRLLEL